MHRSKALRSCLLPTGVAVFAAAFAFAGLAGCGGAVTAATTAASSAPTGGSSGSGSGTGTGDGTGSTGTGSGAGNNTGPTPPAGSFQGLGFSGKVMAGSTPLAGAAVQLYAAGTTGNGSTPTQLLATAAITDPSGAFTVAAGSYSCPLGSSILYVVATGGQVGSGAANGATALLTIAGACSGLGSQPSLTVNELTTVASVYALRPFFAPGAKLGSTATNTGGLALGAATLASLVNLSNGTAPGGGFPANGTAPAAKLDALANILHGCIASSGPASAACMGLFQATASGGAKPSTTLDAALAIANQPAANAAALFSLSTVAPAFSPVLPATPPDWTLTVPFKGGGMHAPASVSVDGAGNVWVVNYFGVASLFSNTGVPTFAKGITGYGLQESYGGAVDANNTMWVANEEDSDASINNGQGSVTLLNSAGPALPGNSLYAAGGLSFPISVAIDSSNIAWIVDYGNAHLTLLNSAGGPQSGAAGYTSDQFAFPVAVAVDSKRHGWLANQSGSTVTEVAPDGSAFSSFPVGNGPSGVAVDAADNVWTANFYGDTLGLVSAGKVLSNGGFTGGGLNHPVGIAADGAGKVWVANYRGAGISELAGASAATPGGALSPAVGWAPDAAPLEAYGVAIDAAGDIWVSSFGDDRLIEYVGIATPVKTPLLGPVRVP